MKKLSYLFALFVLLTAFTCEDEALDEGIIDIDSVVIDDDTDVGNNNGDNPSLIGDWELVEFNADIETQSNVGGMDFNSSFYTEATDSDYILTFAAATYTVSGDYELTTTTTFNGDTSSYTDSYTNVSGSGSYSTSGNIMTIDGSFVEFEVDGMPVDADQGEQTAEFELSDDGQTLTFYQDIVQEEVQPGTTVTVYTTGTSVWNKLD